MLIPVPANTCPHCGAPTKGYEPSRRHVATCRTDRRRALEMALFSREYLYRCRIIDCRELQAELIVVFNGDEDDIRSFLNVYVDCEEIVASVMRLLPEVAKDTALLAHIRSLKEPLLPTL